MQYLNYTIEEFIEAVASCSSVRQVLLKLGLAPYGGNYATCARRIKKLELDTSHFHGQLWSKGKTLPPKRELSEYLSNTKTISPLSLKNRLIRENVFEHKCMRCGYSEWCSEPIPLELHHKDGNNNNNELLNLQLLCPNCHALTDNYRGRNQERYLLNKEKRKLLQGNKLIEKKKTFCIDCGKEISLRGAKRCKHCAGLQQETKIQYPLLEELILMIKDTSYVSVAKQLGVSDNGIRKHIERRGINPKTLLPFKNETNTP